MLHPRTRSDRRAFLLAPLLLALAAAGCSGDDDDAGANDTVTVGIDGSGPGTTDESSADESVDTREYPSLEDVGRADFTHTIVAGDFLRKIADTYDVEIDDIVGANEWDDGRDHLLLAGQEIYLPADAVMPDVTEPPSTLDDSSGDEAAPLDLRPACGNGVMVDAVELSPAQAEGATLEEVAEQIDVPADALHRVNDPFPRPAGMPWYIGVPCVENWPEGVAFYDIVDGPICTDGSNIGSYEVQAGDTGESIAASLGVTVEQLDAQNETDLEALSPPQVVVVCASWLE